eukprot:g3561.t1
MLTNDESTSDTDLCAAAFYCEHNSCEACLTNSSANVWLGVCVPAQHVDAFVGDGDGGDDDEFEEPPNWTGDPSSCAVPHTMVQWECSEEEGGGDSDDEIYNCDDAMNAASLSGLTVSKNSMSIGSDFTLYDAATGEFGGSAAMSALFGTVEMDHVSFGVHGGASSAADGPPSAFQTASYAYIPVGGFTDTSLQVTGSSVFFVYDGGFPYSHAAHPNGFGSGDGAPDFTVESSFSQFTGISGSASFDNVTEQMTATFCSDETAPQLCTRMVLSAKDFRYEGIDVPKDATKFDVFVKGISHSTSTDSFVLRTIAVSQTFEETIDVDVPEEANMSAETFGAAYLETKNTVLAKSSAIASATDAGMITKDVVKATKTMSSENCGYGDTDWFNQATVLDGVTYADAQALFAAMGFKGMECTFFSYQLGDSSLTHFLWDPILGVDTASAKTLAQSSAASNDDDDDGVSSAVIIGAVVGAVVVVVVVVAIVAALILRVKK